MERTFFESRIVDALQISEKENQVELFQFDFEAFSFTKKKAKTPVFTEDKDGNIEILVYGLNRKTIHFDNKEATPDRPNIANNRIDTYRLKRWKEPKTDKNGDPVKYMIPKGQGTYPFFHPSLIEKYEKKTKIENLVLTEGYFKAFKACKHGIDCVGLSSIHHGLNKKTGSIHSDIEELINVCHPDTVTILFDGDCRDLSHKALTNGDDLYKRLNSFFSAAENIYKALKEIKGGDFNIIFAHIRSEDIPPNHPKGIDDLYCEYKGNETQITADFIQGKSISSYFHRINITNNINRLLRYFNIDKPESFYNFYETQLKDKQFLYNGTKFSFDEQQKELKVLMPAEAKQYMRVGVDYWRKMLVPSKTGTVNTELRMWSKATISDDHGKKFIDHIPKYLSFCTVPMHTNYQQVIQNCYNKYFAFEHEAIEGECPKTIEFIKHIWGRKIVKLGKHGNKPEAENWELGIDYIQLLYNKPIEMLPILCLVSKERQTGKSTFVNYLARIFKNNCLFVSNEDLSNSFNSPFHGKLLIFVEETLIEKKATLERVKNLATAHETLMNAKGKEQINMDVFMKFIFCSNDEESFIYADEKEIRFWVNKVPAISENLYNKNLLEDLTDEIPYFLNYLNKRQMVTIPASRMHFHPELLRTDALKKVTQNSKPTAEKDIRNFLRNMFIDFDVQEIRMSCKDICEDIFKNKNYNEEYISRILRENMNLSQTVVDGRITVIRYSYPFWINPLHSEEPEIKFKKRQGRPYIFYRADFVTESITYETPVVLPVQEPDFRTNQGDEAPY